MREEFGVAVKEFRVGAADGGEGHEEFGEGPAEIRVGPADGGEEHEEFGKGPATGRSDATCLAEWPKDFGEIRSHFRDVRGRLATLRTNVELVLTNFG